jgi:hypothetical protein
MANRPIQELDVVALTVDLPAQRLYRGQVGTVVHVHTPDDFEVEFVDNDGHTYGLTTLRSEQLLRLHHSPVAAA